MSVAEKLKAARAKRGHSQRAAAKEMNMSLGALTKWEQGQRKPTVLSARRAVELYLKKAGIPHE